MTVLQIILFSAIKIGLIFSAVMGVVTFMPWVERKLIGHFQQRLGPYRVGPFGLLQPFADSIKLFFKEDIIPNQADRVLFVLAPTLAVMTAVMNLAVIPFGAQFNLFGYDLGALQIADVNVGILYIFGIASLGVYSIFLAGWSSNNKYSLLGGLRSSAQMFSYELSLGLSVVTVLMAAGTLSLGEIVASQSGGFWNWWIFSPKWFVLPGLIGFLLLFVSTFAETNRLPFDLPEAETELVAGYHTEYSSMKFAMFFMAEYINMIVASSIVTTLFLGGWNAPLAIPLFSYVPGFLWFAAKVAVLLFIFIWVRATLPRFRYDQLMNFGWKFMLPVALLNIFLAACGLMLGS